MLAWKSENMRLNISVASLRNAQWSILENMQAAHDRNNHVYDENIPFLYKSVKNTEMLGKWTLEEDSRK